MKLFVLPSVLALLSVVTTPAASECTGQHVIGIGFQCSSGGCGDPQIACVVENIPGPPPGFGTVDVCGCTDGDEDPVFAGCQMARYNPAVGPSYIACYFIPNSCGGPPEECVLVEYVWVDEFDEEYPMFECECK